MYTRYTCIHTMNTPYIHLTHPLNALHAPYILHGIGTCGVDNQLPEGVHMGQDKPGYTTSTVVGDTPAWKKDEETEGEENDGT